MTRILHGILHGKTVVLTEPPTGLADGQEVVVTVLGQVEQRQWGDGIRASAGGWATHPELDAVFEQIAKDRKNDNRELVTP
jgi:hypothetical protein